MTIHLFMVRFCFWALLAASQNAKAWFGWDSVSFPEVEPSGCYSSPLIATLQDSGKRGKTLLNLEPGWLWSNGAQASLLVSLPVEEVQIVSWFHRNSGDCEQMLIIPPDQRNMPLLSASTVPDVVTETIDPVTELPPFLHREKRQNLIQKVSQRYRKPPYLGMMRSIALLWHQRRKSFLFYRESDAVSMLLEVPLNVTTVNVEGPVSFAWLHGSHVLVEVIDSTGIWYTTDDMDPVLEFLALLAGHNGLVGTYTNEAGKLIYVMVTGSGKTIFMSKQEAIKLQLLYDLISRIKHLPEQYFQLEAGGGVAPEKWQAEHRSVPFSVLAKLAHLLASYERKESILNLFQQAYAVKETPANRKGKKGKSKGKKEGGKKGKSKGKKEGGGKGKGKRTDNSHSLSSGATPMVSTPMVSTPMVYDRTEPDPPRHAFFIAPKKDAPKVLTDRYELTQLLKRLSECHDLLIIVNRDILQDDLPMALGMALCAMKNLDGVSGLMVSRELHKTLLRGGKRANMPLRAAIDNIIPEYLDYLHFVVNIYQQKIMEVYISSTTKNTGGLIQDVSSPLLFGGLISMLYKSRSLFWHPDYTEKIDRLSGNLRQGIAQSLSAVLLLGEQIARGDPTVRLHLSEEPLSVDQRSERQVMDDILKELIFPDELTYT